MLGTKPIAEKIEVGIPLSHKDPTTGATRKSRAFALSGDLAREVICKQDAFLSNLSQFDRNALTWVPQAWHTVTQDQYLDYLSSQVVDWTQAEIDGLCAIFEDIGKKFHGLDFDLPDEILLVKTTGREEGFSAYTRHDNTIVMSATKVALMEGSAAGDALHPGSNIAALEAIYIHEFFHLFSKNNPKIRDALYHLVGYRQAPGQALKLPPAPWHGMTMPELKITNPDTPELNVCIDLKITEDAASETPLLPVLLAKRPYHFNLFFGYLDWVFLVVDDSDPTHWSIPVDSTGMPTVIPASDPVVQKEYLKKIGRNFSDELFHPDEVLAQNFVLMIDEPNPGLLVKMHGLAFR